MTPDDKRLAQVVATVEANDFESMMLWERNDEGMGTRVTWEEDLRGLFLEIAQVVVAVMGGFSYGPLPVTVRCKFAKLDGQLVMFWHSPSVVTFSEVTDAWVEEHTPAAKVRADADGFHQVLDFLTRKR